MPTTQTPPQNPEDDDAYYRAVLHSLIDQGQALARHILQTAAATPTPESEPDPTIAFDRVARAIRRTIALARHIATTPATSRPNPTSRTQARTQARASIIRSVEDAICVTHRLERNRDQRALTAELHERLDDPDLEFDLANRPVEDIIADICRDLNVASARGANIWRRRTPPDIAALKARAASPPKPPAPKTGHQPPDPPSRATSPPPREQPQPPP